jgi:hypothetical protein
MTVGEKIEKLGRLAEKQGGYITYHDINEMFPDATAEELDKLYVELLLLEIQIVDQAPERDSNSEA